MMQDSTFSLRKTFVPNSSEHQFDHRSMHSDENVAIASSSDDRTMTPVDLSNKAPTPPVFEARLPMYQQHSLLPAYSAAPDVPPMSLPPFLVSPPSLPSDASSSPSSQKESFADLHICPYCNRNFKYKNNLYTHIKNKHKQDNQPSQCEVCGKHFASKASMSFHQNKFHMPQNLACKLCPLRFSLPVYLNAHMKTKHSNAVCNFCCEPMNVVDTPRAHLVDSSCPMCNTTFWCSTFKQQHLDSTTCGAKLLLLQNMLPPMHAAPLLPYPMPMQSSYFCSCPECVRPPLPPPVAPEQAMPPPQTPTCNMCGSTFADMGTLGFHVGVVHVGMGQSYAAGIC